VARARESVLASNRGALLLLALVWAGGCFLLVHVALNYAPETQAETGSTPNLAAWAAFFGALELILFAAFSLLAYRLSFGLFASRLYRGNVARSCQHGLLWSTILTGAGLLRAIKVLTLPTALALIGVLLVGEVVVLLRK